MEKFVGSLLAFKGGTQLVIFEHCLVIVETKTKSEAITIGLKIVKDKFPLVDGYCSYAVHFDSLTTLNNSLSNVQ